MPSPVREQPVRRVGDRSACPVCNDPKPGTVRACDVWQASLNLANGKPALKVG